MRCSGSMIAGVVVAAGFVAAGAGCEQRVTATQWGGMRTEAGHARGETAERLWGGYGAGVRGGIRQRDPNEASHLRRGGSRPAAVTGDNAAAIEAMKKRVEEQAERQAPPEPASPGG